MLVDVIRAMFERRGRRRRPANNLLQAESAGRGVDHRADQGHGARPDLPRRRQGASCTRRAIEGPLRDDRHDGAGDPARPATALGRGRHHPQPHVAHLGRQRVGPGRAGGAAWPRCDAAGNPTIAFLASGIEGIKVRITAKGADEAECRRLLAAEEAELRALLGDQVFGVDDETMEFAVLALLGDVGLSLAVAESVTGGMIASRITNVPGASKVFRGGVVSYASEVKWDLLGVPRAADDAVVTAEAASAMAAGAAKVIGADVGLAVTGVAGPVTCRTGRRPNQPGTVFVGLHAARRGRRGAPPAAGRCATGCASSPPSPPSTGCAIGCWPWRPPLPSTPSALSLGDCGRRSSRSIRRSTSPPSLQEALTGVGLRGFWMTYFVRARPPMGRVSAPVVEATFANFHPTMIGRAIPDAWALAVSDDALDARLAGATQGTAPPAGGPASAADAALLGDRLLDALAQADPLLAGLCSAPTSRLPRPSDPTGLLSGHRGHCVFREHRGDGHVAALTAEGGVALATPTCWPSAGVSPTRPPSRAPGAARRRVGRRRRRPAQPARARRPEQPPHRPRARPRPADRDHHRPPLGRGPRAVRGPISAWPRLTRPRPWPATALAAGRSPVPEPDGLRLHPTWATTLTRHRHLRRARPSLLQLGFSAYSRDPATMVEH